MSARAAFAFIWKLRWPPGSDIEFTLTLPPEITLTESIRVKCKGKVVRVEPELADTKVPVAAVIDEYEFLAEA